MAASILTLMKHLWLDADDTARLIKPAVMDKLTEQVASSERLHQGEIRICIEASLPLSYLWRVNESRSLNEVTRERAVMMFSKLGVWDTALNTGVLIYVLLAEHAIEIVADRGIASRVEAGQWSAMVAEMSADFRGGQAQEGLRRAIDAITAKLVEHFGATPSPGAHPNELPDSPVLS